MNKSPLPAREAAGIPLDDLSVKEILVRAVGWSALERIPYHTITTAVTTPDTTFFDYELMGYNVNQIPQLVWDEEQGKYVEDTLPEFLIPQYERDATEEIALIKASFPLGGWWSKLAEARRCIHPEGCENCNIDRKYHLLNIRNPTMQQFAARALYFRNRESEPPFFAIPYEARLHRVKSRSLPDPDEIVF